MKVLGKYLLREFFRNFLVSLAFFTILLLVVRFSEKEMGRFISWRMTVLESMLSLMYQVPRFIVEVAPPSTLFATFFSLGRMAKNNEITAMKAAGVSLYRVFRPVFIAALLIAICVIVFNDQVVARANRRESEIKQPPSISSRVSRNIVFGSSGGRTFYIDTIFLRNHQMNNVTIYEFDEDNNVRSGTFARKVSWAGATWLLRDGVVRTFKEGGWDEMPYEQKEITVNEDPEIMVKGSKDLREMSFSELSKLVKFKRSAGQIVRRDLVTLYSRISFPFACFIMALLGAPLFIVFGKSGTAVGFLLTMSISFLYWGIAIAVFEAFGNNGKLPPLLSCWMANFIFAVVGAVFVYKVKK
ncbi:LptF/LptG family permease [Candidatus Poribacteria bacterium]